MKSFSRLVPLALLLLLPAASALATVGQTCYMPDPNSCDSRSGEICWQQSGDRSFEGTCVVTGGTGGTGTQCSGQNYSFTGDCRVNCAQENSDTSVSCSPGYVCCSDTPLISTGTGATPVDTGSSATNDICLAYGPGVGCTTSAGLPGHCDSSNFCQADSGSSTGDASCKNKTPGTGCTTYFGTAGQCNASNICEAINGGQPSPYTGATSAGGNTNSNSSGGTGAINMTYLNGYFQSFVSIINTILVPSLIALAFIVFLWGVYKYFIQGAANESDKAEGRKFAMWGIIGFVIIVSVWGLVNIVKTTLNLPSNGSPSNHPAYPTL